MLEILFWVLLILTVIGAFVPESPWISRGRGIVILILIAILGYAVFGLNLHR